MELEYAIDTKTMIDVANLNLSFGNKKVLHDINIGIEEKMVTALIGPSGCGKSTLLRTFNRMHDLNSTVHIEGSVIIDGMNIFNKSIFVNELRKKVGMVFQKPNPFPKSIYDNVAYGLKINGFPKNEISERVEDALIRSFIFEEVKDKLHEPASSLSGGQQQRLCIARTIAIKPEIILMDEPCSALDPISTHKIEELILSLKDQYTIVIVTHNMQQALRVSDYTAFMYLGKLIEFNETNEIFNNAQEELTRNYINGHFG
ncbi:MAG TPA: phosphate ABC transporter ATP-binding protein PstB [Chitinophagaceae bacterium]|nr:phosphate ABC transporter ATP-binding protein PstB [Chitinophagaceae bacterium]